LLVGSKGRPGVTIAVHDILLSRNERQDHSQHGRQVPADIPGHSTALDKQQLRTTLGSSGRSRVVMDSGISLCTKPGACLRNGLSGYRISSRSPASLYWPAASRVTVTLSIRRPVQSHPSPGCAVASASRCGHACFTSTIRTDPRRFRPHPPRGMTGRHRGYLRLVVSAEALCESVHKPLPDNARGAYGVPRVRPIGGLRVHASVPGSACSSAR
jgi:hypothetical protein